MHSKKLLSTTILSKKLLSLTLVSALLVSGCGTGGSSSSAEETVSDLSEYAEDDYEDTGEFLITSDNASVAEGMPEPGTYDQYIQLADYKSMEIEASADTVITDSMTVNIDYSGTINGTVYEGGSEDNYELMLGAGSFSEDFDEAILGHKKGDSFSFSIEFPETYWDDELAGKTVDYDVTINRVYVMTPDIALLQVVENSVVLQYPSDLIDTWTDAYYQQFRIYSVDSSASDTELLEENGYTEDSFDSLIKSLVKTELVCLAMMDEAGISMDSEAFENAVDTALERNGIESREQASEYGYSDISIDNMALEYLAQEILVANEK